MRSSLIIFLFPIIYFLCDITIRFSLIQLFSPLQLLFYGISILCSTLLFVLGILVLNNLKKRSIAYYSVLSLFSIYIVISIIGSYAFYYINGFYPNFYTYEYFKNEPLSAIILLKDSIDLKDLIIFLISFSIVFYSLKRLSFRSIKWNTKKVFFILFIGYIGIFSLLVFKVKKYDQCLIVDTNFSAALNRHLFEWETERKFTGRGLGQRKPYLLKTTKEKKDFNVLVIVFESLRKQNLEAYGYSRHTTPNLRSFENNHQDEFFVFENPYTVSTTTMLAVPAVLTGIGPYQSPEIFYSQPIIWEYSKMLNYRNFFISSHSLKWYRFDNYYKKNKPDQFWSKETSKHPFFNDLGIDDAFTIKQLNSYIKEKDEDPFFGVVQLNSTHYPYNVPKEFKKWNKTFLDEYNNSILYQDHVIGKLFEQLKKSGKLENTVIIFTSDHGESLKDHNNIGHVDSYYTETISIPLMLYLPKTILANYDIETLRSNLSKTTSNIDIAPTIVELLGLNKNKDLEEINSNFTGYSLFQKIPKGRNVITMNNNKIARFKVGLSLINENYHYIHRMNIVPNREEIYNIKKDKKESNNLIDEINKIVKQKLLYNFQEYPICAKYLPLK